MTAFLFPRSSGALSGHAAAPAFVLAVARTAEARADALRPLLVGHFHDAIEPPTALMSMLRQSGGTPWWLGLQLAHASQPHIDAYLYSNGDAKARAALLDGCSRANEAQGTPSLTAIVQLIDFVRVLRARGCNIRMACFDDGRMGADDARGDAPCTAALRAAFIDGKRLRTPAAKTTSVPC